MKYRNEAQENIAESTKFVHGTENKLGKFKHFIIQKEQLSCDLLVSFAFLKTIQLASDVLPFLWLERNMIADE